MGNILLSREYEDSDNDVEYEIEMPLDEFVQELDAGLPTIDDSILERIVSRASISVCTDEMPVIRKRPDISTFCHSKLYKEIKALCAYPANSHLPCERFSLTRGLLKRENGTVSNLRTGTFSANQHRRIRTLFVPNNKEERLMSLESKVFTCSFNKTGSKLITGCQDAHVRIYDSSKGTYHLLHRLRVPDVNYSILDLDISPCDQFFAYSTWSNYFFLIDINGGVEKTKWFELNNTQNRNAVYSIRFSPCGGSLISGCSNSCVYLCDLQTSHVRTIRTKTGPPVDINAVSYVTDRDTNVFVSGCNNGSVKLWDLRCVANRRNQPVGVFLGHLDGVTYLDSRNDGHYILSNSKDQSIKIWDLRMTTPSSKVNKYSNRPDIEWDYRWDMVPQEYYNPRNPLDGDVSVMTYRGHRVTKSLLRAKFSPLEQTGQRYIYTGCGTGRIIIYDVLTGLIKEAIHGHKDIVRDLGWHPVRSEIVSSSWDSHVNLNTFKPNPLLKRASSDKLRGEPRRRSLRIENQNNTEPNVEQGQDGPNEPW